MSTYKGYIKQQNGDILLPISRGELILAADGSCAFHHVDFVANDKRIGLMQPADLANIQDALDRVSAIEESLGDNGAVATDIEDIKTRLTAAETEIGNKAGVKDGQPVEATGLYKYVDDEIAAKIAASDAMVFKGTVTQASPLPLTHVIGDTYKVAEAGLYTVGLNGGSAVTQQAKPGDMFIALVTNTGGALAAEEWSYIPSADDMFLRTQNGETTGNSLAGTITIKGGEGVIVSQDDNTNVITITLTGAAAAALAARLDTLEGIVGLTATTGLQGKVGTIETTLGSAVTNSEAATNGDGSQNDNYANSILNDANADKLVKASAVKSALVNLATHISNALYFEAIALDTPLTTAQKALFAGTIVNDTVI